MRNLVILGLGLAAFGCGGGGTVDAEGEYTVALSNQDNGCMLANWDDNGTATGIPVTIAQTDDAVTATVGGAAGVALGVWLGSNDYTGDIDGNHLDLELEGQTDLTMGDCDYHYVSVIDARLDGDVLEGEIRYETVTDGAADCGALEGCASVQDFNGTRPPQ